MRLHSEKDIAPKRSLWLWHDHSSLASHGIFAVMVGVVYNPVLFLSESESPGVQEFIEKGEIHFIAHGSSLADQACIIPEKLAELEGLNKPLFTSGGVCVFDTLKSSRVTSQQLSLKLVYHVEETFLVLAVFALLLASQISLMLLLVSSVP